MLQRIVADAIIEADPVHAEPATTGVFDTSDPNAGMSRWGVNASIGAEF